MKGTTVQQLIKLALTDAKTRTAAELEKSFSDTQAMQPWIN